MGPTTDPLTEHQNQQESMFDDPSFPEPEATESSAEQVYTEEASTSDSLPDEEPDEDVFAHPAPATGTAPEPESEPESQPLTVLTMGDFAALEERVLRAVNLVRRERQARQAAEERLLLVESQLLAKAPALEQLQQEVEALRLEREQVRVRVERLLSQLDALEL